MIVIDIYNIDAGLCLIWFVTPKRQLYIKTVQTLYLSHHMRKPTIYLGEKAQISFAVTQLRSNCEADSAFVFTTRKVQFLFYLNPKFQILALFCDCTGRFVSDLFGNHIVGFPTRWLISLTLCLTLLSTWNTSFGR